MDDTGCVIKSTIVPPTSQNQARIEQDLKDSLITFGLDKTKEQLKLHAEKVIRNYDPCISCATHFLNLNLIRDTETEFEFEFEKTNKIEISFKNIDLSRTAIIGIGSPHRGDESGWDMIDRLLENEKMQSLQKKGLTLLKLDRPGLMLIEPLKNYQQVLLIDAIKPAKTNPTFISIDIDHDSHQFNSTSRFLSTHEAGMIRSIELFMSLKLSATKIKIIAVSNASDQTTSEILNMF
jgi:hydrogenase maturation protease